MRKKNELCRDQEWTNGRDSAASWFEVEMLESLINEYDTNEIVFPPISKSTISKDEGIGIIKDIFLEKKIVVSDRAVKFMWELKNQRKKAGKIVKENDHLVDCLRYFIKLSNYTLTKNKPVKDVSEKRGYRIEEDLEDDIKENDQGLYIPINIEY